MGWKGVGVERWCDGRMGWVGKGLGRRGDGWEGDGMGWKGLEWRLGLGW